ncbi:hypothetical protein [Arcobacter roscoffensis]|uniref:Uncharacterized protein n=1 Tax=Arcobacter roscoffensis TaxID=2961520 RepID=A0ABY5E460_9BACT|nr:hypothetical protein [Arcobacter roscoffensis]UTJ06525.1 hypothetical protein NJU99_00090 [Arcobacter roscoffensis]
MKNIFIIVLIVVSMAYMVNILVDKYNNIIEQEQQQKQKVLPQQPVQK